MAPISLGTFRSNFLSKELEASSYTDYQGSPESLPSFLARAVDDYMSLMAEDYQWQHASWQDQTIKGGMPAVLSSVIEDLKRTRTAHLVFVKAMQNSKFAGVVDSAFFSAADKLDKQLTGFLGRLADKQLERGVVSPNVAPPPKTQSLKSKSRASSSSVVSDAEPVMARIDDDSETETEGAEFETVMRKRQKRGVNAEVPIKHKRMTLSEFRAMPECDGTPDFTDKDNVWGFGEGDRKAVCFRTHSVWAKYDKTDGHLLSSSELAVLPASRILNKEKHPAKYIYFSECSPSVLKTCYLSNYFPKSVYHSALSAKLFTDDLDAIGKGLSFEEIEKAVPGAGETADVFFWMARTLDLLEKNGHSNKLAIFNKWMPRLLGVPDVLRSQAGEAARHIYCWVAAEMRKPKEVRKINSVINSMLSGMLAKWPKGWDREKMITTYRKAVLGLWGKDHTAVFIEEFKKTTDGQRLFRPKEDAILESIKRRAANVRVEASRSFAAIAKASGEVSTEAKAKATKLVQEYARLDERLAWHEQMRVWGGRFRASLPQFWNSPPKALKQLISAGTHKRPQNLPQTRYDTARTWIAATIGSPFYRLDTVAEATTDPEVSLIRTDIVPRKWWESVLDFFSDTKVDPATGEVKSFDYIPGLAGTASALASTAQWLFIDFPTYALSNLGAYWNNIDKGDDEIIDEPEKPPVGRLLRGYGTMLFTGTVAALFAAPTLAAATAITATVGVGVAVARDAWSWLTGREYDDQTGQWVKSSTIGKRREAEVFDVSSMHGVVFDADEPPAGDYRPPAASADVEISLKDNRAVPDSPVTSSGE